MLTTAHPIPERSVVHAPVRERLDAWLLRCLASRIGRAPLRYALRRSVLSPPSLRPVATLRAYCW